MVVNVRMALFLTISIRHLNHGCFLPVPTSQRALKRRDCNPCKTSRSKPLFNRRVYLIDTGAQQHRERDVMKPLLLTNALIINEDLRYPADILIDKGRIQKIASLIPSRTEWQVIDVRGKWVIPGMIDDQVHFREPGLTHKGTIASESAAAVMGGITSFMEMPNVTPPTTTLQALREKFQRASHSSLANYSFYFGATNDNLDELKALTASQACGVKVFMGASTGNMLVDDEQILESIFANAPCLVATHCEHTPTIKHNEETWRARLGDAIPAGEHAAIRSVDACLTSSHQAVSMAKNIVPDYMSCISPPQMNSLSLMLLPRWRRCARKPLQLKPAFITCF